MSATPIGIHGRIPYLYPALVVHLHLEDLAPEDAPRLDRAADLVRDWIGADLRFTRNSRVARVDYADFELQGDYAEFCRRRHARFWGAAAEQRLRAVGLPNQA